MSGPVWRGPVWALVPAKPFARAKSRLAGVLDPEGKAALARSMLDHVLTALAASEGIGGVLVVTSGEEAAILARERGAATAREVEGAPLGEIVDAGLADLAARGAAGALVLMSDLPRLTAREVDDLVRMMRDHEVVIAPDFRGEGTNALGLSPPDRLRTSFGTRGSFERHAAVARAAGLRVGVHRSPGLELDIDAPEDLARLREG